MMYRALMVAALLIAAGVTVFYRPAEQGYGWTVDRPAAVREYDCKTVIDNVISGGPWRSTIQRYGDAEPPSPCDKHHTEQRLIETYFSYDPADMVVEVQMPMLNDVLAFVVITAVAYGALGGLFLLTRELRRG